MTPALDIISGILLLLGCFFCLSGIVGLLRFPGFFTRIHGAALVDSLGTILILLGLMLKTDGDIVLIKLVIILGFLLVTGATAVHALAKSALYGGLAPEVVNNQVVKRETKDV